MESTIYTVAGKEFELKHFGVKGMKWGRRKARPESIGRTSSSKPSTADEATSKEARRVKAKRAAKIGAAVVAAGLAAYGAKKASDVLKDKAYKKALNRGERALRAYMRIPTSSTVNGQYNPGAALVRDVNRIRDLRDRNARYAERASRNTVAAVKELLGKNYELSPADLARLNIKTVEPKRFNPRR